VFDELYRQFDRIGGTHLVVFDEINHLEEANTLLYELPRGRVNETKLGTCSVSWERLRPSRLAARVQRGRYGFTEYQMRVRKRASQIRI
jgi:Cdc6-like AAA superfamily ATPase